MTFRPSAALITGGGTGIGRGLASVLHKRGVKVIITGRRADTLESVCRAHPGMVAQTMDVANRDSVAAAWRDALAKVPGIDCVINNAGMQRQHDWTRPEDLDWPMLDAEIDINLRGVMHVCAATLPHLTSKKQSTLINVSSGLAFVPFATMPVYCATKAALHSFTLSLRHQLQGSTVRVVEVIPPAVSTDLHDYMGPHGKSIGIPLEAFIAETMQELDAGRDEFSVEQAKNLSGVMAPHFSQVFAGLNTSRP